MQKAEDSNPGRLAMVGFDGADWLRIEQLLRAGRLPNLRRIFDRGVSGQLESTANRYAGGVWPDFYTGRDVSQHGIYHNKLWRAEHMRVETPDDRWLGLRPFHERLSEAGLNVCVIDLPMVLGQPRPVNGVTLNGWGTHDLISSGSWPKSLWQELVSRHGSPSMPTERFGKQTQETLLELRTQLMAANCQVGAVAAELIGRSQPDFSCTVFGAAHRAGHYLWDSGQVDADDAARVLIESALDDILSDIDTRLGELLATFPIDTTVIAFAVHGMETNHGWSDLGGAIIDELLSAMEGKAPEHGVLFRLKQSLPSHIIGPLLNRLPKPVTRLLTRLWSASMYDWTSTRCFPLPMDQAGYIRINLRGRERNGIVDAVDYDRFCDELAAHFTAIHDADDESATLVSSISFPWREAQPDSLARDLLPDIVLEWSQIGIRGTRALACGTLPGFSLDVPDRTLSGRSGNHAGRGWFAASGPKLWSGTAKGHSIADLAPTVFALLGQPIPEDFEGSAINLFNNPSISPGRTP